VRSVRTALGRRRRALAALLVAIGLAPLGLVAAAGPASGDTPAPSAKASAAPRSTVVLLRPPPPMAGVVLGRTPPDPTALVSKEQWVYDLRYSAGDLYLLGIHHLELTAPQATPRAMGRFALELYEGPTLLERARFDFPMLGDGADLVPPLEAGAPLPIQGRPPSLTAKISTRVGVMFPATPRGTRLDIVDRATERHWPLPWPPTEMMASAAPADATAGEARQAADAGAGNGG
jgi:hypothetical protein